LEGVFEDTLEVIAEQEMMLEAGRIVKKHRQAAGPEHDVEAALRRHMGA
jgi:hypothetical protein